MTVVDLVRILRRHLLIIIVGALIGVMAAAAYVLTRPTVYSATSKGVVVAGDSLSVGDTISANSVTVQRASMYAGLGSSANLYGEIQKILTKQGLPQAAGGGLSMSPEGTSPFINVTATGKTARDAQALANAAIAALRIEGLRLETFPKTKGAPTSEAEMEKLTNIHLMVYNPAGLPGAPARPNLLRNLIAGALGGAGLAAIFVVARRAFDSKVRTQEEVEQLTGRSVLAVVPESKALRKGEKPAVVRGAAGEAMRQLRTNLRFVSVDNPPRSVVITSPTPGDGKSTVAAHLARLIAAAGEKVVLIDCDLRLPTQAEQFGIDGHVGLTQVVAGDVPLQDALVDTSVAGLQVLPAGRTPPNPSELLGSRTTRALIDELSVDHTVILDAPPVLAVTDGALLSSLADGVILVSRMGTTHKAQLEQAAKLLDQAKGAILGTVMNRASAKRMGDSAYSYGYGYGAGSYGKYHSAYAKATEEAERAAEEAAIDPKSRRGRRRADQGARR